MKYFILFFIVLFSIGCGDEKLTPQIDTATLEGNIPVQESWNSKILFTEDGKLKAILYSDHLVVYENKKETLLFGVKIDFYDEFEEKSSSLTSKKGRVDDLTKNMFAIDSVVAIGNSGVKLTTDELIWRDKDSKIVTDKFVTIITEAEKIEGYGFESDQDLSNYVIYNITYNTKLK